MDMPLSGLTKLGFTMWPLLLLLLLEDGHWKLLLLWMLLLVLGDAFRREDAGMNSGDWGVTWRDGKGIIECLGN